MSDEEFRSAVKDRRTHEFEAILTKFPKADVNWKDEEGWTALHCACAYGPDSAVKFLLGRDDVKLGANNRRQTPLYFACQGNKVETVRKLLRHRDMHFMVNMRSDDGSTALSIAAMWGNAEVVRLLLQSGYNLDPGPKGTRSDPRYMALLSRNDQVIRLINTKFPMSL